MVRLLWLAPAREDPEESFPALLGIRPAPEPMAFSEATPESVARRSPDVILADGRVAAAEAAALIHKLRNETEGAFLVVLRPADLADFDWTCGAADFVAAECTPEEVRSRIDLIASPVEADASDIIRRGPITIDRERFEVRVHSERLDLTFKEFELLAYLAARP
ncbi:MAG TPA: hypothetical protein VKW77_02205, partial [Acidimicrobiales bacterium]|nr:hypothetical protein [Acidimicrobiales bacterium]